MAPDRLHAARGRTGRAGLDRRVVKMREVGNALKVIMARHHERPSKKSFG
jgi:hypothetical protein